MPSRRWQEHGGASLNQYISQVGFFLGKGLRFASGCFLAMGWILLQTTIPKGNIPSCSDHIQCLSQGAMLGLGRVPSPAVAPGLPG